MSVENGKVCCNCRHNIRKPKQTYIVCHCDIDNHYISYTECMLGWCRHWSKDKAGDTDGNRKSISAKIPDQIDKQYREDIFFNRREK